MHTKISNRQDWIINFLGDYELDKKELAQNYVMQMINRTIQMFEYDNLPNTIMKKDMEYIIQTLGFGIFTKVDGNYYVFNGSLGGEPNEYYLPTLAIVANPYLKYNAQLKIDEDCVIIKNDSLYLGLMNLAKKYAILLSETDISIKFACVNSRIPMIIAAETERDKKDAQDMMDQVYEGKKIGIITARAGIDSITTYPYNGNTHNYVNELLELHQYLKANWYIDLGINANYNMKRESLSQNEVAVNEDTLLPLIDDMIHVREEAIEKINSKYGLNIKVRFNSAWYKIKKEIQLEQEYQEAEIEAMEKEDAIEGNETEHNISGDSEDKSNNDSE